MKKMNKLTVAALALVSLAFASTAASAQVATTAGDLILGFDITGAPNAGPTDLEVDLGAASTFLNATTTIDLSSKLSVSDLIAAFGSGWASNTLGSGVNWGAAANAPGANATTKFDLVLTNSVASKPSGTGTNLLNGYFQDITQLTTGSGGISNATAASTSTSALIGNSGSPASGIAASWTSQEAKLAGLNANIEATGATSDELYQYVSAGSTGTTVDLGKLTLSATGGLTFTPAAAVPEPSAYALGICAVLLFIVLRRRQMVA